MPISGVQSGYLVITVLVRALLNETTMWLVVYWISKC